MEVWASPSSELGSIGVVAQHVDRSRALEKEGRKITLIHAGRYKVETADSEPLSDPARDFLQSRVDSFYRMFTEDVAKGRGVSENKVIRDFGGGRMLGAENSVRLGMADKIGTLDQAIESLMPRRSRVEDHRSGRLALVRQGDVDDSDVYGF